jgi:hypothetical protein
VLIECASCGEILLDETALCSKCRTANPFYRRPERSPLAKTLIVFAGLAILVALPPLVSPHLPTGAGPFLKAALRIGMASAALLLGSLCVGYACLELSRRRRVMAEGKRSVGTITRTVLSYDRSDFDDVARVSPVVRFVTDAGDPVEFQASPRTVLRWSRLYWPEVHQEGQRVEVAYDPALPSRAFVVGRPYPGTWQPVLQGIGFIVGGLMLLFQADR